MQDILEGQCRLRAYINYVREGNFNKWKEDGERFLQTNFIHSSTFPIINDGKIELDEWLQETKVINFFYLYWEPIDSLFGIKKFFTKLMRLYKKQRKEKLKSYINEFSEIIKCLQYEIRENYDVWSIDEEEEEKEADYKDEETQTE